MYDRGTQTLWIQFLGKPVVGPLADSGIRLEILPVVVTTWEEWLAAHPDTTVLDVNTGVYSARTYLPETNPNSFYYSYRESPGTMFPVRPPRDVLPTKAQVLGLNINAQAKAYPLELLRQEPVINDSLGDENLVVITVAEAGAARAYQRGNDLFSLAPSSEGEVGVLILIDQNDRRWRMEEEALVQVSDPSQTHQRLPSHMAYWFGWSGFYPASEVYGEASNTP